MGGESFLLGSGFLAFIFLSLLSSILAMLSSSSRKREGEMASSGSIWGEGGFVVWEIAFFSTTGSFFAMEPSFLSGRFFSITAFVCAGLGGGEAAGIGFLTTGTGFGRDGAREMLRETFFSATAGSWGESVFTK